MRRTVGIHQSLAPAVAALAAAVLAACGSVSAPQSLVGHRPAAAAGAAFIRQARLVSARWSRSPAAARWHAGLVLTDGAEIVEMPRNAGFASQRQKDMFASGHFALATTLPARPPDDVVRWASGAIMRLPVLSARAAFTALATPTPCGGPYRCGSLGNLTVTSMRPTSITMPTSRGPAQIPAWQFRAAQLTWPFTEVAVAPRALIVLSAPVPGDEPASELGGVSADGRTLTLLAPVGVCVGEHAPRVSPEVYQTASTVVVGMQMSAPAQPPPAASQVCAGVTELARVRAKLARPLGTRVLLDVNSGQPLVTWEPPPA